MSKIFPSLSFPKPPNQKNILMTDEVLEAKKLLSRHFDGDADFRSIPTKTSEIKEIEIIKALGVPPTELQFGPGLDIANGIANWKREKRFERLRRQHPDWPVIVAEGDSWFLHPLVADIIDHLSTRYLVRSYAAAGDTFEGMLSQAQVEGGLKKHESSILLLSAGGNDLLGDRFGSWLHPYRNGAGKEDARSFLNDDYALTIKSIMKSYTSFITELLSRHSNLHIIVHGYDFVVPRYNSQGKWLGKALSVKGFKEAQDELRLEILREIVDEFNELLLILSKNSEVSGRLHVVDARGTVRNWYDEIHPDADNSMRIAELFHRKIASILS
jgi:hypothetical protein